MQPPHLLDIIALEDLQQLQDAFVDVAHVASIICNVDGTPITEPSNFTNFCRMMREHGATNDRCVFSNKSLGEASYIARKPAQGICCNLSLVDGAAPIILSGRHVATWMIGQRTLRHLPESEVLDFARMDGLPLEKTLAEYKRIPLLSEQEFRNTLKLLSLFSSHLSDVCYKNHLLKEADAEKDRAISILQTVMANVDPSVYVNDPETHRLVYVNEQLCEQIGTHDVIGRLCHELLQGLDEPCPFCPHKYLFDEQGAPLPAPYRWEFHNPKLDRDYLISDRLITWHDGRLLHLEVATDVTERKALALAEAANMAKRDFLARMSHELRTPMNGVLGMTYLALQAGPPPAQREYLKKIQSSASLLLGIINDILDFSRIEAGKIEIECLPFSPREAFDNARELILPRVKEKGLAFSPDIDPSVPEFALGDGIKLTQVLLNLLGNAIKFTSAGGIALSMRAVEEDEEFFRLECRVADTGIGMSEKQREVLFKPFSQADSSISRQFGGTGLGLSISKALVELMNGKIVVDSTPGNGSVFSFHIRLKTHALHGEAPAPVTPAFVRHSGRDGYKGKRLLVVEDNEINQEIAVALLEGLGVVVNVAGNGVEGVHAFLENDYSLIFMDIRMPEMDGLEAARHIRASGKHDAVSVPIIAMTANAMAEDREASGKAGMNGHIAKPIDPREIEHLLARWLSG